MNKLCVHIGTHKTGSTSLQRWLFQNKDLLKSKGYQLYEGAHILDNHIELYLAAMRYERDSFGKQAMKGVSINTNYTSAVTKRVQQFISERKEENLIFTTEGLSLLRHRDELVKLKEILDCDCNEIKFILFLRDKKDYLKSYTKQLYKTPGRKKSQNYWSALYIEEDTWLTEYDDLISAYNGVFGDGSVVVIDYDKEMGKHGNIIYSFASVAGLALNAEEKENAESYRLNATM